MMRSLVLLLAVALTLPALASTADAGWRSSRGSSISRPPTGVGSNLHRRFVIKHTAQRAARGQPTRRHVGVYIAGGYPGRVVRSGR